MAATPPEGDPLAAALAALGGPPDGAARLHRYAALLRRWNRAFNLVSRRDEAELERRHLLDSLVAAPFLRGPRVLDLGSGAGLPGIPLAVARPALAFVLADRRARRTRFLEEAVAALGLENVRVATVDVRRWEEGRGAFGTVVARAVAPLPELAALARPLLAPEGRLVAIKGPRLEEELAGLAGWRIARPRPPALGQPATTTLVVLEPGTGAPPDGGHGSSAARMQER